MAALLNWEVMRPHAKPENPVQLATQLQVEITLLISKMLTKPCGRTLYVTG